MQRSFHVVANLVFCLLITAACGDRVEEQAGKRYPGATWDKAETPETLGYSSKILAEARKYTKVMVNCVSVT